MRDGHAVIEVDTSIRITRWDSGAVALYGWTAEEAAGRPLWMIIPRHRRAFVEGLWPGIQAGGSVGPYVGIHTRKDGERVAVEIKLEPVRGANGEIVGARGHVWPIGPEMASAEGPGVRVRVEADPLTR